MPRQLSVGEAATTGQLPVGECNIEADTLRSTGPVRKRRERKLNVSLHACQYSSSSFTAREAGGFATFEKAAKKKDNAMELI